MVREGTPPATLCRWLLRLAHPVSSRERAEVRSFLAECEKVKLGVEPSSQIHSPRAPLFFNVVYSNSM